MLAHCLVYFTGMDLRKIKDCVGDPQADADNPVLKAEQDAQVNNFCSNLYLILLYGLALIIKPFCLFC